MNRNKKIIQTSIIGICVNFVLVLIKMIIGLFTNSIAVILDAVNNLGDALSSIITIIGTKLAGKKPDRKHPYGYGRIEYLTSALISLIVLMAGFTSLKESVLKILNPEDAAYNIMSIVIIASAVVIKFACGRYVKSVGEKINSQALIASGTDAFFDSILSSGTLIAACISLFFGISLEGFLGVIISVIIVKAGIEILSETLSSIIGTRADPELTKSVKSYVNQYEGVRGAYDLALHNYGPTKMIGSIHIEVDDTMQAKELHRLTRRITVGVFETYGIILTVGIYASNTLKGKETELKDEVEAIVKSHVEVLQMHGFYAELEEKSVSFDMVISFKCNENEVRDDIKKELYEKFPDFTFHIVLDSDFSDI